MPTIESSSQKSLKNILFLTDFSEPSEAALPFAAAMAREYRAKIYALNVFTPVPHGHRTSELTVAAIEAEEDAKADMQRVEAALVGLAHKIIVERGIDVWPAVQQATKDHNIDLIVLGTHGRTGAEKFLLGSIAEEVFLRSLVPVLTIGPKVGNGAHEGRFRQILCATDFTADSAVAVPYALSLMRENRARLVLLHVMRHCNTQSSDEENRFQRSVAETIHKLYETVPKDVELPYPLEVAVEYGQTADKIVAAAQQRRADLIVLGVGDATKHIGAATHLERATAHKVVVHAHCPVLTVRQKGSDTAAAFPGL